MPKLRKQNVTFLFIGVYCLYIAFPIVQSTVLNTLFPHLEEILYPRASLLRLFGEHLLLVVLSGTSAFVTGTLLGIAVTRPWGREFLQPVQDLTALLQTFPPVAVLTLAVPAVGFGFTPAYIALYIYSILPIVRNTITGLLNVPPTLKEAARGMGMTPLQVLLKAELPHAFPAILAGTRISIIINVGTTTIGGVIGAGGLGVAIVAGLVRDNTSFVLQGAIAAAGLAFLADYLFELWEHKTTIALTPDE